jgi:1-acyl-sn-glycerol-3-phosphate acyltransferase
MYVIRGYYRFCLCALTLGLGATLIIPLSWLPFRVKGYRLSFWVLKLTVVSLLAIMNVKVSCTEPENLRRHEGFFFPNHVSYLDVMVLVAITPTRFLAKYTIRTWPVVGPIARAIGCVFVKRGDKASRSEARAAMAKVKRFPPVTLFPEGKRGPGDRLLPFRYGAFEIMIQGNIPFLPCAIVYDRLDIAIWHRSEHFFKAIWRLLGRRHGRIYCHIIPLEIIHPAATDDPVQLSLETHQKLNAVLEQHQYQQAALAA